MFLEIILLLSAIICFYVALRLIITCFPNFLTRERVGKIEELLQFAPGEFESVRRKKPNRQKVFVLSGKALMHTKVLSYFVENEQSKNLKRRADKIKKQIDDSTEKAEYFHCLQCFYATKEKIDGLSYQPIAELDYPSSMNKLTEMEANLPKGFELIAVIENLCQEISKAIENLTTSNDVEIVEASNTICECFQEALRETNSNDLSCPSELARISRNFAELQQVIQSIQSEPQEQRKSVADWVDYYSVLGVEKNASAEEIKHAFRKKMIECHPDRKQATINKIDDSEVKKEIERVYNEKAMLVSEAFKTLSDPALKSLYDEKYHNRNGRK